MAQHAEDLYYVPHGSKWPIVGSLGMVTMLVSAANWMNGSATAQWTFWLGLGIMIFMLFGWFGTVIRESEAGMYNAQVDGSFRLGMSWFIYSEVMFFAVFFGALFYARALSVPWLGGEGAGAITNEILWQGYMPVWPTNGPANVGGEFGTIPAFGIPFMNTDLETCMKKALCVYTYSSTSGVDAMLAGKQVIAESSASMVYDLVGHSVKDIKKKPKEPEGRKQWFANLACRQWPIEEIRNGNAWKYLMSGGNG